MSAFYNVDQPPFNMSSAARAIAAANNGLLFDIGDMSTLYQDAAGTVPVTAVEQPVGLILDKSGNGNHATQSVTASRPTLSAMYNLLTKTEGLGDVVKTNVTTTPNSAISPRGDMTACLVTNTAIGGYFSQSDATASSTLRSCRVCVKNSSTGWVRLVIASLATGVNAAGIFVNTLTGAKGNSVVLGTGYSLVYANSELKENGWVEIVVVVSGPAEIMRPVFSISTENGVNGGSGASVLVWGLDQRIGDVRNFRYQRVNTATDYDTDPRYFPKYLRFDVVDDYLNLPYMGLYANGSASIIAARDVVSQATDTYIISERSTTDADPKYFPSRQLARGGNMDAYISDDAAAVVLDTVGSAFGGAADKVIRSVVDTGSNLKLYKNGVIAADDNYTRAGTLTLNNTTLGASVSTTTGNYAAMKLYGLIVTKSALTDAQRVRCERFLARKAGVML